MRRRFYINIRRRACRQASTRKRRNRCWDKEKEDNGASGTIQEYDPLEDKYVVLPRVQSKSTVPFKSIRFCRAFAVQALTQSIVSDMNASASFHIAPAIPALCFFASFRAYSRIVLPRFFCKAVKAMA